MSPPCGLLSWLAVLVAAIALSGTIVEASEELILERQNPSFITQLPTTASSPLIFATSAPFNTIVPPLATSTLSQVAPPLRTTVTPAATRSPTLTMTFPGMESSSPLVRPLPTSAGNPSQTSQGRSSTVGDAFYGRIPTVTPDGPIVSVFLVVFLVLAITHCLHYRATITRRSRWAPRAYLSRLIALFCVARVAACALRLVWIGFNNSAVLTFLAVVTENAGTVLLVAVNFHLTKKMISFCNLSYSLWARSIISRVANFTVGIVFSATFLLNAFGVALFEVAVTSGSDPTIEAHLVQVSEALLVLFGLLFNFAFLATMATTSLTSSVDRLTAKIITYFLGAGLLTLASQLMRFIAAFLIWKPITPLSAELLSKTAYYVTGFGAEVVILILYGFWETNLLALQRHPFLPRHNSPIFDRSTMKSPTGDSRPTFQTFTARILRTESMEVSKSEEDDHGVGDDINEGAQENSRSTIISISNSSLDDRGAKDVEKLAGSRQPLGITVHKTFTVSTTRNSTAIGKAI